ncbi:phospholipase A [Paraburkholderia hayleyella]|uniref:phospholipase A n=1 Tax=Paraburkholderia hayleyella TaxID=2152889 RepID=UPI0012920B5B|nr:phospholipase A [Paraburkholderia hayleyella]
MRLNALPFCLRPRRPGGAFVLAALISLGAVIGLEREACAGSAMLAPAREAAASEPLQITLLYTSDNAGKPLTLVVPPTLRLMLTSNDLAPQPIELIREPGIPDTLRLRPGEYRKVSFSAPWPAFARGMVRLDPVGFDASPALVTINRGANQLAIAKAERAETDASTPAQVAAVSARIKPAGEPLAASGDTLTTNRDAFARISYFEPMYVGVGHNGDTTARFQFSFKYRVMMPDDLRSKRFLDNLYFAYTQTSIWDLSKASKPFRDTSYQPQVFYDVADTGWHSPWFSRMGMMAGIGHESNGKAGADSRSINIAFVRPTWEFGDLEANHLSISPKLYYYIEKSDNRDIADYRGYMDLLVKYGSPNGWQLATTLRKGMKSWYGSVDAQLTYPLARLIGSAWGGYVWLGYFNGYGEDILDYNRRQHTVVRIGYSISR